MRSKLYVICLMFFDISAISWASVGVAYALNLLTLVILVVIFCAIKYCNRKRRKKYAEDDMPIYTRK